MDAILLVLRTGMQWNALNATGICSSSSAHRRFQELPRRRALEQPLGRFLDRGEVRNLGQFQRRDKRRMVRQMRHDAAVVGLQEVLQRQARRASRLAA
jgi:hypothetical protein